MSHCGSDWLHDIALREYEFGFAHGLLLGVFGCCLFAACIAAVAYAEREGRRAS